MHCATQVCFGCRSEAAHLHIDARIGELCLRRSGCVIAASAAGFSIVICCVCRLCSTALLCAGLRWLALACPRAPSAGCSGPAAGP